MDAELGELALVNFCPGLEADLRSSSCCLCSLSFPTWEMEAAPRISKYSVRLSSFLLLQLSSDFVDRAYLSLSFVKVSYSPGWPQTCYVAKDELEFLHLQSARIRDVHHPGMDQGLL